jgi:hypothetical protein
LLQVLTEHEGQCIDGYVEGLRAEYLTDRSTLQDLVQHQDKLAKTLGMNPGESVVGNILARSRGEIVGAGGGGGSSTATSSRWDAQVARTSAAELSRHAGQMGRRCRALLDLEGELYSVRIAKITAMKPPDAYDPLSLVLQALAQPRIVLVSANASGRAKLSIRAAECLVALRRWQTAHQGLPGDLPSVVKDAGLTSVPIDPYDGKPLRLTLVDGHLVIYSVGKDGKDDAGRLNSDFDRKSGDLIYPLPEVDDHPVIRGALHRRRPFAALTLPS